MSGIEGIIEIINKKTAEKEKEIIHEAEKVKKLRLEDAEKKAKETSDEITKRAELQAKAEMARYEASAKLKSKYQLLRSKEQLIADVLDTATKKLFGIVGKDEYKKVLTKLAVDGGINLNSDALELILPKNHSTYIDTTEVERAVSKGTGKKTKVSISKETLRAKGGVMIRMPDTTKWVDNTFEARMERLEEKARTLIATTLFADENKK
jgi:vacuolar-type H+-ATPase subunit E/Vma4